MENSEPQRANVEKPTINNLRGVCEVKVQEPNAGKQCRKVGKWQESKREAENTAKRPSMAPTGRESWRKVIVLV